MSSSIRGSRGFSIYELMIVVAIIGICLGWAFPSFLEAMRLNRIAARTNELVTGLNLARMEAIRRGNDVVICSSTDRETCGGDWVDGWIVFNDPDSNLVADSLANDIVRVTDPQEGITATAAATLRQIVFNSRGIASNLPAPDAERIITLQPTSESGCPSGALVVRNLRVSTTGQIGVGKAECP
jgi:type IV fimbrial biogenesis protein FimT